MSFDNVGFDITLEASGDLSAQQYRAGVVDANGRVAVAGADAAIAGVLQGNEDALGNAARVRIVGVTKARAGAAIAARDRLATNASGDLITRVAEVNFAGTALTAAGASGEIIAVLLD